MSKKILPFLVLFILFSCFNVVFADVVINEIMYAPESGSDYEWVEIYNNGNDQVNLDGWRFFNSESSSAPLRTSNSFILEPHSYALIISSSSLFSFSGQIFTSSQFSLPNDSSKFNTYKGIFSDSNKAIGNSITYDTSLGGNDGNSLSKINSGWSGATPTPGEENETIIPPPSLPETSGGIDSGGIVYEESNNTKETEELKIKTQIIAPKIIFAGIPVVLEIKSFGHNKELLHYGKYFLNFGDGDSKEIKMSDNQKISHTYMYAGDYVLSSEYYMNVYGDVPDASLQITIKVISTDVTISKVGDEKDFFVELSNNADKDGDISGWVLVGKEKDFILPRNTILGAKKKIIISSKITGFTILDKDFLKLMTMQGSLVFDYGAILVPEVPNTARQGLAEINSPHPSPLLIKEREQEKIIDSSVRQDLTQKEGVKVEQIKILEEILVNNLPASVSESIMENEPTNSYLPMFASIIFIGISAGAVYFIRRKKSIKVVGDDFAILDD